MFWKLSELIERYRLNQVWEQNADTSVSHYKNNKLSHYNVIQICFYFITRFRSEGTCQYNTCKYN